MNLLSMAAGLMLVAGSAAFGGEIVFIGLAGEGSPAIEKQFSRVIQERIRMVPGVHLADNAEVLRLQSQIALLNDPAISSNLAASLKRVAPDTGLVAWGVIKSCSIHAVRRRLVHAELHGELSLELAVYSPAMGDYAFRGDITATTVKDKGYCFWFGPIDEAVPVSASDRSEMLDSLQSRAAVSLAATVKLVEAKLPAGAAQPAADSAKKTAKPGDSPPPGGAVDASGQRGQ
jgi:hypothetical protein